ncbi:MAG: serine/threonine protein kinase, partial [Candidatus Eisenbacteria bacterium]|nr:serine/threonine protein kinase [Candidatus Eisenbacteria bacterium]
YVMELLEGPTLEQFVVDHGPMPPERVVHVLGQICDALADAHERGLIHRDMKPGNVMLCRRGLEPDFVKVVDFGMVHEVRVQSPRLTGEHTFAGTPGYVAPEFARGDRTDARADLYGVGAIGYWMLAGTRAFAGENAMEVVLRQLQEDPVPPSAHDRPEIPGWLDALILRCLSRDPAERPRSARELQQLLSDGDLAARWTRERADRWWSEAEAGALHRES